MRLKDGVGVRRLQCSIFIYGQYWLWHSSVELTAKSGHKFYLTNLSVTVQQYQTLNAIKIIGMKIIGIKTMLDYYIFTYNFPFQPCIS